MYGAGKVSSSIIIDASFMVVQSEESDGKSDDFGQFGRHQKLSRCFFFIETIFYLFLKILVSVRVLHHSHHQLPLQPGLEPLQSSNNP